MNSIQSSSSLGCRPFSESKEAELLGLSQPLFEKQSANISHIGSFLNKRSSKQSKPCSKQQQQQEPSTMTTKQQKKHEKTQKVSVKHHIMLIESDCSVSQTLCSEEEPSDYCKSLNTKRSSPNSIKTPAVKPKGTPSASKKTTTTTIKSSLFLLEATSSASSSTTAATSIQEEFDEEFFDKYSSAEEIDFTKRSKKFKGDEDLKQNLRKDSLLSNSSDATHINWYDHPELMSRKTSMDFNLTPIASVASISTSKSCSSHNLNDTSLLDTPYLFPSTKDQSIIEDESIGEGSVQSAVWEAKKLVEQRMGRLAAEIELNDLPCCTLSIRCFLKHTFSLTVDEILNGSWCMQCDENLTAAQAYASENNGACLNKFFEKSLTFRCEKNHEWESPHHSYKQRWCANCRQIAKDQFKQYIKEQEAMKQAEYERNQEEIYREARERAMRDQNTGKSPLDGSDYSSKVIGAAKLVELEVQKIAEAQAAEYISTEQAGKEFPCKLIDVTEVIKLILFPEQILSLYFTNLSVSTLKEHYRNVARNVHPDKNRHPKAAEAFQKLNNFYSAALPKN